MIRYKITDKNDLKDLMNIRFEMLRIVNDLDDSFEYSKEIIDNTREYFLNGQQTTVLAYDEENAIGCATMSYINIMPTFSHPTGKRAHLMNVYTNSAYRRSGIAKKMVEMLMDEARGRGVTEISLDATESGRPLYESMGFVASDECMLMNL